MKKYLSIAAAAAMVLAGCTEGLYGPTPSPEPKVDAKGIDIQISEAADSSFVLTLTPEDTSALFYSYAVIAGELKQVDSAVLYADGYAEGAVASDVIKNVAPYKSSIKISKLNPFTSYTVYAVASSSTGVVGAVASKSVKTSDSEAPVIDEESLFFDEIANIEAGNTVSIKFSESVSYVKDAGVVVKYYGLYSSDHDILENDPIGTGSAEVTVEGNVVSFAISGVPAGAYYSVSFAEGAFVDAAGNKAEATASGYLLYQEFEVAMGIVGRIETESFGFVADSVGVVANLTEAISLAFPEGLELGSFDTKVAASVVYKNGSEVRSYSDIAPSDAGANLYTLSEDFSIVIVTPNAELSSRQDPERGSIVTITIPEGWLYDIYGNPNAEYTVGPFIYSYGYEAETAIYGSYSFSTASAFTGTPCADEITISASDSEEAEEGEVVLEGTLSGIPVKIYGIFDGVQGTISVSASQLVGQLEDYVYDDAGEPVLGEDDKPLTKVYDLIILTTTTGRDLIKDDLVFDVPAAHKLSFRNNAYIAIVEVDGSSIVGFADVLYIKSISAK